MNGEKDVDPGELQRERAKHEAALRVSEQKIAAIEKARLEREEAERKRCEEVASLPKKVAACGEMIAWIERKIVDLKAVAQAQAWMAVEGHMEATLNMKGTLAEIQEWGLEIAIFKELETSLPGKIEALTASA